MWPCSIHAIVYGIPSRVYMPYEDGQHARGPDDSEPFIAYTPAEHPRPLYGRESLRRGARDGLHQELAAYR